MNAWMKLDKLDQLDVGNLSKKKCLSTHFQILKIDPFTQSVSEIRIYLLRKIGFFQTSINFFSIMIIPLKALKPQYSENKFNL